MGNTRTLLIGLLTCAAVLIGAQQAVAREFDNVTPGRYPGNLPCVNNGSGAIACYQEKGDKIWVKDSVKDDHSAYAYWEYPTHKRTGLCKNGLGSRKWGYCNKNFTEEGVSFYFWAVEHGWTEWSNMGDVES